VQLLLRFEPDGQIAVGRLSVLGPEIPGALRNLVVERCAINVGGAGNLGR
jgi:hypothetical protein